MSSDTFFRKQTTINFTVKNISPSRKKQTIFNYPIEYGQTRDLLSIPEIGEADIRHSLIKGELVNKLRNREIEIVSSSIDLLQFDSEQRKFLEDHGVDFGLELSSENITDIWVDSHNKSPLIDQSGTVDNPYTTIQAAVDHAAAITSDGAFRIRIAFGIYGHPINIPEGKIFVFEAPVRANEAFLGNITWHVTGDRSSALVFKSAVIGKVTILDGSVPAINAIVAFENCVSSGIESLGSSFITATYAGITLANFNTTITDVVASAVNANSININNGKLFANSTQFGPLCTFIQCGSIFASLCSFQQPIMLYDLGAEFKDSTWTAPNNIIFNNAYGLSLFDNSSNFAFEQAGGEVINGQVRVITSLSSNTGILSGGIVSRASGLNLNIGSGSGIIFFSDAAIDHINWENQLLSVPPNSFFYVLVNNTNTVFTDNVIDPNQQIVLAKGYSDSSNIIVLTTTQVQVNSAIAKYALYIKEVIGPITVTGLAAGIHNISSLQIDVGSGTFYMNNSRLDAISNFPIVFRYWYRNGSGGYITSGNNNFIDPNNYDDGSGTLAVLPSGKFKKDLLFVSVNGSGTEYHVVYGQEIFNDSSSAASGNIPSTPPQLVDTSLRVASVVVQKSASTINMVIDVRPFLGQFVSTSLTNDHGLLNGLLDDDHPQYQLRSEKNTVNGYAGLDGYGLVPGNRLTYGIIANTACVGNDSRLPTASQKDALVGTSGSPSSSNTYVTDADSRNTNARAPTAHELSHLPNGSDPLPTAVPVTVSNANSIGVANSFARSDHAHAHGNLTGGSTHALAVADPGGSAGFLSGSDKAKLDGIASGATNSPLSNTVSINVTKAAASAGVSSEAARQDHKHDISTAIVGTINIGDAAAEGSATTLARSDHTHALTAPAAPINVNVAIASAGLATTVARSDHKHSIDVAIVGAINVGDAASAGTSNSLSRADHIHSLAAPAAPANANAAAASAGTSVNVAREDHKHQIDTAIVGTISIGDTAAAGTANTLARSDHTHALTAPAAPVNVTKAAASAGVATTVARSDHKHDISTAAPGTISIGDASTEGIAATLARSDHTHTLTAPAAPVNVTKAAASAGSATTVARSDHKHDISTAAPGTISIGDASTEGSATTLARSDHTHTLTAPAAPVNTNAAAAVVGVATTVARSDHKHQIDVATAVDVGAANSAGVSNSLSRADHVHRGSILQSVFAEISADTTTASTTFVDLISQAVTTTGGNLLIYFTCASSNTNNNTDITFRITVDGTSKRGTQVRITPAGVTQSCSIITKVTGLSAAAHTVKIQWLTSANTARVRPVAAVDAEHASLIINEIIV